MQAAEFLKEYASVLRGLTRNDKTQINTLSMLAEDNKKFAEGVVGVIEQHILTCPPPGKLPALYLVDSIIKNVGEPYKAKFSERLPEVFGAVWDTTLQDKRSSLSRLYGTWAGVLSQHVLARVQNRMVSISNGRQATVAAHPSLLAMPPMQPVQPQLLQQGLQLQYALGGQGIQVIQQPQAQPYMGLAQQHIGLAQPQYINIGGNLVPFSALQPSALVQQPNVLMHPVPLQQPQPVQHTTPQHVMQAVVPPVSPAHPTWPQSAQQQQPQQPATGAGPMIRCNLNSPAACGGLDAFPGPPPPQPGRSTIRNSGSPLPNSAGLTNDALSKLLSNLTNTGLLAAAKAEAAAIKLTEFQPAFLKVLLSRVASRNTVGAAQQQQQQVVSLQRMHAAPANSVLHTWLHLCCQLPDACMHAHSCCSCLSSVAQRSCSPCICHAAMLASMCIYKVIKAVNVRFRTLRSEVLAIGQLVGVVRQQMKQPCRPEQCTAGALLCSGVRANSCRLPQCTLLSPLRPVEVGDNTACRVF
eukprot:GHRR01004693.1.p1 GENE.GHRR01004693.1~~GHRR01004693.1.p1  ORF type:complete len:525 (+),score=171.95 GHRR01004693.1:120-1694(+)